MRTEISPTATTRATAPHPTSAWRAQPRPEAPGRGPPGSIGGGATLAMEGTYSTGGGGRETGKGKRETKDRGRCRRTTSSVLRFTLYVSRRVCHISRLPSWRDLPPGRLPVASVDRRRRARRSRRLRGDDVHPSAEGFRARDLPARHHHRDPRDRRDDDRPLRRRAPDPDLARGSLGRDEERDHRRRGQELLQARRARPAPHLRGADGGRQEQAVLAGRVDPDPAAGAAHLPLAAQD